MTKPYILGTKGVAKTRLEIQGGVIDQQSLPFLHKFVKPGMHVLEVGCGAGNATLLIAKLLKYSGYLTAIDLRPEFIKLTKTKLSDRGYTNSSVLELPLEQASTLNQKYDLIYGRMVLHHIGDVSRVISSLLKLLKPGGTIAFEEPIVGDLICYPEDSAFNTRNKLFLQLGECEELSFDIAKKLPSLFKIYQTNIKHCGFVQSTLQTYSERCLIPMLIEECYDKLIQHKLIDEMSYHQLIDELYKLIETDALITHARFLQIACSVAG